MAEDSLGPDDLLAKAFDRARLTKEQWTHEAHVRCGFIALQRMPFHEALAWMRTRIRRLNEAQGGVNSEDAGYHETITHAFLRLIEAARNAEPRVSSSAHFYATHPALSRSSVLTLHYSKARLTSREARAAFVLPDLAPLPGE